MRPAPSAEVDLYSDVVLSDPYPTYRALRDLGSAVYLPKLSAYFIGRFKDVRAALGDWQRFSSSDGIGLNPIINGAWNEALICQDPPIHTVRRKLIDEVLGPRSLKPVEETIAGRADDLARRIAQAGMFDGVVDCAHDLPVNVVMDLIGWPADVRPRLIALSSGSWNAAGPPGPRMQSGLTQLEQMMELIAQIYDANRVTPGGFAASLIAAAHRGEISRETAIGMLAGYIVAAFETTISAIASGLWCFATHPAEWDALRADPSLAMSAANEIVRFDAPLQNFARRTRADVTLSDDTGVPAGSWVIVSYASANRDERQFGAPDTFRIERPEKLNLGFGAGPHACAGQALARMELKAVFTALAARIRRLELAGEPERELNNVSRGFRRLPLRCIPA